MYYRICLRKEIKNKIFIRLLLCIRCFANCFSYVASSIFTATQEVEIIFMLQMGNRSARKIPGSRIRRRIGSPPSHHSLEEQREGAVLWDIQMLVHYARRYIFWFLSRSCFSLKQGWAILDHPHIAKLPPLIYS